MMLLGANFKMDIVRVDSLFNIIILLMVKHEIKLITLSFHLYIYW